MVLRRGCYILDDVKKSIVITIVLALTIAGISAPFAMAEISPAKLDAIRANCDVARSTMQRIVSSDKTMRINRGRVYDRMGKLLNNFSERLAQNDKSNPKLNDLANRYDNQVASFRSNYDTYRQVIDNVIKSECVNQPTVFYENLDKARTRRQQLNEDMLTIEKTILEFRTIVDEIAKGLK